MLPQIRRYGMHYKLILKIKIILVILKNTYLREKKKLQQYYIFSQDSRNNRIFKMLQFIILPIKSFKILLLFKLFVKALNKK